MVHLHADLDGSLPNGDLVLILAACWAGSRTVPDGIIVTSGGPATIKALSKRSFFLESGREHWPVI